MLLLVFAVQALCSQISFASLLQVPRSLQVNHRSTYEDFDPSEHKHLAIIEVFKADSAIQLPTFSWALYGAQDLNIYNISQSYYEIELYHELQDIRHLIWSSNKIESKHHFCNLNHIKHHNLKQVLQSFKWDILSFRVRSTYDEKRGIYTKWSKFGTFVVTSAMKTDWSNASYIAQSTKTSFNSAAPRFIKTFSLTQGKQISSAVISIVGLGFFRLTINNMDLLQSHNPPIYQIGAWTNTKYRVPYATFDVTRFVSSVGGYANVIRVDLGEGYRNKTAYAPQDQDDWSTNDDIDCVLKLQLIVKYTDDTQEVIVTDDSWETYTTAITLSSIYNGETYNETSPITQETVETVSGPAGILSATMQPYVSIMEKVKPMNTIYRLRNSQIVDFGENNAGIVRINVGELELKKGDEINMKFAEIKLHPPYGPANGSLYYANLRSALQYDTFVSDGESTGFWTPSFTMHGFRYMEVWGSNRDLTVNDVQKLVIYANVKKRANWSSSDETLNKVNQRCINGQLSNLKSIPTDCNQRDERLGWMGDAALSSNTFCINFDLKSFWIHYLQLMADEQAKDGSLPDVVPYYRYGGRPSDPNWGIAFPQVINVLYQYYGASFVDVIKQYMNAPAYNLPLYIKGLQSRMPPNITDYPASYGDWVPPAPAAKISNHFAGAFAYIETVRIIKQFANIIGNISYEQYLDSLQCGLTKQFIAGFYDGNQYLNGLQTSYAMALHSEIYSDAAMKTSLQNNLIKQINADNNLLTTGIIGAKLILPILSDMNQEALALSLIKGEGTNNKNASYPSWAYEQDATMEPATAIWELWNAPDAGPGMNSRNHHMYSSVSGYLNTDIAGIRNKAYSYDHWDIIIGHLSYDELRWSIFESDDGLIRYHWKWLTQNQLTLDIVVPIGYFGHLNFKINTVNKYCKMQERNDDNYAWDIVSGNIRNVKQFMERYDAKMDADGSLMCGSGHYEWSLFCK